jgi:hypothetical protein
MTPIHLHGVVASESYMICGTGKRFYKVISSCVLIQLLPISASFCAQIHVILFISQFMLYVYGQCKCYVLYFI